MVTMKTAIIIFIDLILPCERHNSLLTTYRDRFNILLLPEVLVPLKAVVPREDVFIYRTAADWFTRIIGRKNIIVRDAIPQIDANKQPVKKGLVAIAITNLRKDRNLVEYLDVVAEARMTRDKLIGDGLDPHNIEDANTIGWMVGVSVRDSLARLRTPQILERLSTRM